MIRESIIHLPERVQCIQKTFILWWSAGNLKRNIKAVLKFFEASVTQPVERLISVHCVLDCNNSSYGDEFVR